jgi:hypothetical protein
MKNYLYTLLPDLEGIYYEEAEESHLFNAVHKVKDSYSLFISSHLPSGYQILPDREKSIYYKIRKLLNLHYTSCVNILESSARGVNHEFRVRKSYGCYLVYGPDHSIVMHRDGIQILNHSGKNLGYEYIILPDTFYNVLQRTRDVLIELDKVWDSI